jgi:PhnB protein
MASSNVKPIPAGYHSVTPHMTVDDAAKAIDFYKKAFGAEEMSRMPGPGGKIMHAELRIFGSVVMLADEMPGMGNKSPKTLGSTTGGIMLYTDNVDASFKRATDAGAKVTMPLADQFWGDRYGQVADPFGHLWSLAQHIEDVQPAEMKKRMDAFFASQKH